MAKLTRTTVRVPETVPMGHAPRTPPEHVIHLEVHLKLSGSNVDIYYRRTAAREELPQGVDIDEYLKRLIRNHTVPEWNNDPDLGQPGKSNLSIRHDEYSYLIFWLSNRNWQFSEELEPFQVETGGDRYYLDPRTVWQEDGDYHTGRVTPEGCSAKIACFVANAKDDQQNSPNYPDFRTRFNIYVDFVLPASNRRRRLLPIAIDPDVGHPEGTRP